jgi:hypothetical protein
MTIRPPDPVLKGQTALIYMTETPSHLAVRHLLHLAFRDCVTVLDLTYGAGGFWNDPLPPGITVLRNILDASREAEFHRDYGETGLPASSADLVAFDPPHTADNGEGGHFKQRYGGTVKGNIALMADIRTGVAEAWRLASIGILVKVADSSHGGEYLPESTWVQQEVGRVPYAVIHTVKPHPILDPKHRVQRVPKSNGAVYLAFRKDSHRHKNWDALYERQERALHSRHGPDRRLDAHTATADRQDAWGRAAARYGSARLLHGRLPGDHG